MQTEYISKAQAAEILHVSTNCLPKIAEKNAVAVHAVPGHNRTKYRRADILKLAAEAQQVAGKGAGA